MLNGYAAISRAIIKTCSVARITDDGELVHDVFEKLELRPFMMQGQPLFL